MGIEDIYWITPEFSVIVAGVVGLLVGSFLNVVIHRLPLMMQRRSMTLWTGSEARKKRAQAPPRKAQKQAMRQGASRARLVPLMMRLLPHKARKRSKPQTERRISNRPRPLRCRAHRMLKPRARRRQI